MEIQALKVIITSEDVNALIKKHWPEEHPVEDVAIKLTSGGIMVKGVYPLFINVSFETHWALGVQDGKVSARLTNLRALGVPGNIFKSAILKLIGDAARSESWLEISDDTILVNVDRVLLKNGLPARTNLTRITCQDGAIVVEAAAP